MLKQLISLLLSKFFSKQETELVGHQAMPQDGGTTISTTTTYVGSDWVSVANFTAHTDGYCMARIRSSAMFGFVQISAGEGINAVAATNTANAGQWVHQTLPIRKGASVKVQVSNGDNILVKFFSTIGGGYSIHKKYSLLGGTICLKSLLTCLQRNSYRTNESGWLISQQLLLKALLSYLLLQMEKVTYSRCRTRELLTSEAMAFGLLILEGSTLSISDNLRMETSRSGLTLKKVKNLPTQLGNQISSLLPIFEYTKSRGTIDLMLGGASC